jgi:DNA-binding MarR family transcriptional regulator/GNAT superfamily N-acetyltransferase
MSEPAGLIAEMRSFNRFYTRTIGLLEEKLTDSPFTLTEARVLFELGHRNGAGVLQIAGERGFLADAFNLNVGPAASEVARELRLDPAYLTRILRRFVAAGLTEVRTDHADRRRRILSLTKKGAAALAGLQAAADRDMARLVGDLSEEKSHELAGAMHKMTRLLGGIADDEPAIVLRPHAIGDVGWVIERQSRLYAEEYGWNGEYEALVAEIGAAFIRNFQPGKEFCWVAEKAGERVGAVFLVRKSNEDGQLRLLHVERTARGLGVGSQLVAECVATARRVGYRKLVLWTNDVLADARRLYERTGFTLAGEERHHSFGKDLVGQNWELEL